MLSQNDFKNLALSLLVTILTFQVACQGQSGRPSSFSAAEGLNRGGLSSSTAGGSDGGGGKGVLCGDKLRLLDLYEAEVVDHLEPGPMFSEMGSELKYYSAIAIAHRSETPVDVNSTKVQGEALVAFLMEAARVGLMLEGKRDWDDNAIKFTQDGERVPITQDATVKPLPPGCSLVQIAFLKKDGDVRIDKAYWKQLDFRNRTALLVHEVFYRSDREVSHQLKTSDLVRKAVGLIFSAQDQPVLKAIWNKQSEFDGFGMENKTPVSQVHFVEETRNGQAGVAIYFLELNNDFMPSPTSAFVPGKTLADRKQYKSGVPINSEDAKKPDSFWPDEPVTIYNPILNKSWKWKGDNIGDNIVPVK